MVRPRVASGRIGTWISGMVGTPLVTTGLFEYIGRGEKMKVVINSCFGDFGLSHKAIVRYAELAGFHQSIHEVHSHGNSYLAL